MNTPIVELNNVSKTYSTAAGEFPALKNVNLSVNSGEFLGVVGKSGAGKSTLLNMINGVDELSNGEVLVNTGGQRVSVHHLTEDDKALWRGKTMGVVYQSFQLLPMLTLIENITLPMDLAGNFKPRELRQRALELLRLVEIEEHADKLPAFVSVVSNSVLPLRAPLPTTPIFLLLMNPPEI